MKLSEKAKLIKVRSKNIPLNKEVMELSIEWLKGNVTTQQVSKVLYPSMDKFSYIATSKLALALRQAYLTELLKIK